MKKSTVMKHILPIFILLFALSCDTWDDDLYRNPNTPQRLDETEEEIDIEPFQFLPGILTDIMDGWDYITWNVGAAVCEYHGKTKSLSQGNRHKSWHALEYVWDPCYGAVLNTKNMRNAAIAKGDNRFLAIANIWECYNFFNLTLLYGDIPYSESIMEEAPVTPKYDKQSELYPALISKLKEAGLLIDPSAPAVNPEYDYIFQGDMLKWKKFANTLLVRYAMYMSDAAPEEAKQLINEIVGNPATYPVMESNMDNAFYHYGFERRRAIFYNRLSKAKIEEAPFSNIFIERLVSLKDPRLPVYARPVKEAHTNSSNNVIPSNKGTDKYAGHLYGITTDNSHAVTWNGGAKYASPVGEYFRKENDLGEATIESAEVPQALATYAELMFFLAEASEKGWLSTGEDAKIYYEEGIKASFEQYNATFTSEKYTAAFGNEALTTAEQYLWQESVDYGKGRDKLTLIAEQKWIASFMLMFEPYFDHRRTMLPKLRASNGAENFAASGSGSKFPSRAAYPASEDAQNETNVEAARAGGFNVPIVNDETRNEALMWLLQPKGNTWLQMPTFTEPAYKKDYPAIEGEAEYGETFKNWYDNNWKSMFWWENNVQ